MSRKIFPDKSWGIEYHGICKWKEGIWPRGPPTPALCLSPLQGCSNRHFSDRGIQRQEQRSWMCDSTKRGIQKEITWIVLLCFWSLNQIICRKLHGSGILKTALIYFSSFNPFQEILLRVHYEQVNWRPSTILEYHWKIKYKLETLRLFRYS